MKKITLRPRTLRYLLIPTAVRRVVQTQLLRLLGEQARFRGKSNAEIFNLIYTEGLWGRGQDGEGTSGSGSHTTELTDRYIASVDTFLDQIGAPTSLVDLGCGDFSVGSRLVESAETYLACDVSSVILTQNRARWEFPNVEFRQLDISKDPLPPARVAFVRQVLQHLSNADIEAFVGKLQVEKPYDFLVVTEHLPNVSDFIPNLDKDSGANIRLYKNSGVLLHAPPFNLGALDWEIICEVDEPVYGISGIIQTIVYHV